MLCLGQKCAPMTPATESTNTELIFPDDVPSIPAIYPHVQSVMSSPEWAVRAQVGISAWTKSRVNFGRCTLLYHSYLGRTISSVHFTDAFLSLLKIASWPLDGDRERSMKISRSSPLY